jgi:hypothetical protein
MGISGAMKIPQVNGIAILIARPKPEVAMLSLGLV